MMKTTQKIKSWFNFDWLKKTELVELKEVDCSQDPVRPELEHDGEIKAVMCFGFVNEIPKTVEDLDVLSKDAYLQATHRAGIQGSIAIAYTVWSLQKGGGKMIVNEVYKMIKKSNHLNRLITLSPLTKMAEKFHLRNGAKLIQKNETTQNFEYTVIK
jgi:hypothetical protein